MSGMAFVDDIANSLPFVWNETTAGEGETITVIPCPVLMGDVNEDGVVNVPDLVYMVNYIFKSGPDPLPMRTVGDVNCSGGLGGADIIYCVRYLYKSGPPPCGCYVEII